MIIALANSKGGVGKSTLAVHLAVWWQEQGAKVTLVDADAQGASSIWLHEALPQAAIFRLQSPDDILDRMPGLQRDFKQVVVDGPAGLSEVTRAILLVSDLALLPCGPSVLDLRAAHEAIRVVRQAQAIRHGPPQAALVPNKLQVQYRLSRELLESARSLEVPCTDGLRLRQAYADAAGQGTVVWRLGPRGEAAASEIKGLFHGLFRPEPKDDAGSVANG
ncbi:MAG: ParA family protein [Candidatus Omnitrophica bacterium]|nr:ParA family protein [Candidatus Omnitrophota bacterium]